VLAILLARPKLPAHLLELLVDGVDLIFRRETNPCAAIGRKGWALAIN
jgi:hypothetical protein